MDLLQTFRIATASGESFAHPEKPKDVDKKSAYIIGTGLAGLTAAFYLVRDGQMKGENTLPRPPSPPPSSR